MAKQCGDIKITGSVDGLCFYTMDGEYYVRMASSLTGKRVKKDKAFALTMVYAGLLGKASKIAAVLYRAIPKEERKHALYRELTGKAMRLLKEGYEADEVMTLLGPKAAPVAAAKVKSKVDKNELAFVEGLLKKVFENDVVADNSGYCAVPAAIALPP